MFRKLNFRFVLLIAVSVFFTGGCSGYRAGSIANPKYKTIAIGQVVNNTMEPLASAYLRKLLAEKFMTDGSMRVVKASEADCIIYINIDKIKTTASSYDSTDSEDRYRPAEWSMRMTIRFTVIEPGKARPVIPERTLTASARYAVTVDQYADRRSGLELLSNNISERIVEYTVEAW